MRKLANYFLKNSHKFQYSPLFESLSNLPYVLMAIMWINYKGLTVWPLLYFTVIISVVGIVLHIVTRRLVYIYAYQLISYCFVIFVFFMIAILLLTDDQQPMKRLLVIFFLSVAIVGGGLYYFRRTQRRIEALPFIPAGSLNVKTGEFDPEPSSSTMKSNADKNTERIDSILKWAPLSAGFAMALTHGLSRSAVDLIMAVVAIVIATGVSSAGGSTFASLIATQKWEKIHKKSIVVKR